ncbi:alpha-ketoacid dehydrogenase subunit beta [Candidatus Uhrbacteria bacterium]|nr:alpha-ketoacid dehydrogenase subunit beta [Candidatus Uhrbacteria bacterium]
MSLENRPLTYSLAINEALKQMMEKDPSVILIGQGVKSPWYVGNTCKDLIETFGQDRVIDTPVSENGITGVAVGAAVVGMKTIVVHPRVDFMMYAMDPIINEAANWHYMFGGKSSVPVVFWGIINRHGEQAAQHSQALQALFAHIPGLKVVMPATPYDAKGLMIAAIEDPNPVVFIDDRDLYGMEDHVPQEYYSIPIGKGEIRKQGIDITVVAISAMGPLALEAGQTLEKEGISCEVIDPRTLKPLDEDLIFSSVKKTGRLAVIESAWKTGGVAGEIVARVAEECFSFLKAPIQRITLPDTPAPMSRTLEDAYYLKLKDIIEKIRSLTKG